MSDVLDIKTDATEAPAAPNKPEATVGDLEAFMAAEHTLQDKVTSSGPVDALVSASPPQHVILDQPAADFQVDPIPEAGPVVMAGALAAGAIKIPVATGVGNIIAGATSVPIFNIPSLSDGSASNAWDPTVGGAIQTIAGDLTIGEGSRSAQRRRGTMLQTALNDDDKAVAVLGKSWREFYTMNYANVPTGTLTMIPDQDTHRIFIYRDADSKALWCNLVKTGLRDSMKFMFVNLSAAETAGTNAQWTITINATGGTFTVTYNSVTSAPIAYNAIASVAQTALDAVFGVGNSSVALGGSVYTITFKNALGNQVISGVTTNASLLTGGTSSATPASSVTGIPAQGQLVVVANGTGIAGAVSSAAINRFTLSRGAVLVLRAVPPALAATVGYDFMVEQKFGTMAIS